MIGGLPSDYDSIFGRESKRAVCYTYLSPTPSPQVGLIESNVKSKSREMQWEQTQGKCGLGGRTKCFYH